MYMQLTTTIITSISHAISKLHIIDFTNPGCQGLLCIPGVKYLHENLLACVHFTIVCVKIRVILHNSGTTHM